MPDDFLPPRAPSKPVQQPVPQHLQQPVQQPQPVQNPAPSPTVRTPGPQRGHRANADNFAHEITGWVSALDTIFYIKVGLILILGVVAIGMEYSLNQNIMRSILASAGLVLLVGILWLAYRFSMLFMRFMQANIEVLIQVRNRL